MSSRLLAVVLAAALAGGCSSGAGSSRPDGADRVFLQDMIVHHQRAIEVGRLASRQGGDARSIAFGRRIVTEQTPELGTMQAVVAQTHLRVDPGAGARMATNRISDAQLGTLDTLHGRAFDLRFLTLSIASEQGAAAMARTELAHGRDAAARKLAKAIAGAPHSEIPELRALLRNLS